jgi:hypothetical protein
MGKQPLAKERKSHEPTVASRAPDPGRSQPATGLFTSVLSLQRAVGNRAVSKLVGHNKLVGHKENTAAHPGLPVRRPGDPAEREADRVAEQVMREPADGAARDEPLQVQRAAFGPTTSPSGRAQTAPASVDRALAGAGSPLERGVRRDMEGRFGRDFSQVRLHTGPAAERSAEQLNAEAYTVGNDIVFGRDRPSPETQEGRGMLAHELAHVVQQAGGVGRRVVARKLRVGLDGWGSNLFGDDDSQVFFTPKGDFRTTEFDRKLKGTTTYSEMVARLREGFGTGSLVQSDMEVPIAGGKVGTGGTIPIKAGMKGTVTITVHAYFDMDEKSNDSYEHDLACSWEVQAGMDGKLKIGSPMIGNDAIGDSEAPFQLNGLNPAQDADMGSVQISPQYTSFQFTDIPNIQIGGGFESKSGAGGQAGATLGNETTYPAGMLVRTFKLNLQVTDIPKPKEPEGTVLFGPISRLAEWEVRFPPPRRGKGIDAVSRAEEQSLIGWYNSLSAATKAQIIAGTTPVSLEGRASTTGDPNMNRELANRRMENVKRILSQFLGNKAVFEFRAPGEYEATTENDIESDEERVVKVTTWDQISEGEPGWNQGP